MIFFDGCLRVKRRRGAVAVLVVICLIPLIGVLAMVLDGALFLGEQRRAQAAADATAHAAACSLYKNYSINQGLDPGGLARTAALSIASGNGYTNNGTNSKVTLNIPPLSGKFVGKSGYAEAIIDYYQPKLFSAIWGAGNQTITGRAVARGMLSPYSNASLIVLNPSGAGSLAVSGSGHVIASSAVQVNSTNSGAVSATNAGYIKAPNINITGNYTTSSSGYLSGTVATNAPSVSDPLSTLTPPSTSGLTTRGAIPTYGSFTMNPGVYSGGVSIGGGSTVTMSPGLYYMQGGSFSIANGATVTGSGVTVYVDSGGGQISFQGGGNITLGASTSGPYAGVVLYLDRNSSQGLNIANGSTSNITGTVYAPSATATFAGGASSSQYGSQFVVKTMNVSNNANVTVNWSSTSVSRSRSLSIVE